MLVSDRKDATSSDRKPVSSRESSPSKGNSPALFDAGEKAPVIATPKLPKLDAGKPREVWQRFFSERKPQPGEVSAIVSFLTREQNHEHVIACIETALIQSQPQPWMYEVLGLSMQFAGRPKQDIERVMLSRVDFSAASVPDLLVSAAYLKRLGFDERALALYQQASRLAPARPEPYVLGLRIARDRQDVAGVKWGAVGVLTNVWQPGYEALHRDAEGVAIAVEEELRKAGQQAEADILKASVAAAHQRDLSIRLSWSGSADLDLSVEEPNGTICSFDNPYSEAGGAHIHDGYGPQADNCFEEYICASGLSGDYLVRIQSVAGDVVGRRAELTIRRYVGTPDESTKTMSIPIDGKDKVVRLSLNEGRRMSLREKPTDDDATSDAQVRDLFEPAPRLTTARQAVGSGAGQGSGRGGNGGAIGFQPTITTISDGVGLSAMAVVTGDRRYVKMSLAPLFQQVIEVNSFTIPSGR